MMNFLNIILIGMSYAQPLYMNFQLQEDYVPILGYHQIDDYTDSLTITEEHYQDQIKYLTQTYGCNWITMKTLSEYITKQEKLPTKTCIINFDDGTNAQYHKGLCALNENKAHATFYVMPDDFGTSGGYYMTFDEVTSLHNLGHDIESHTRTHARLSAISDDEQYDEIVNSKKILEDMGFNITTLAYPFGAYNDYTIELTEQHYILGRDTSQDRSWKDIRTPVISYNDNYKQHFFYIKPEGYTGEQLADLIKYTGWWQFEDNFRIVTGNAGAFSNSIYHATDTSYAILSMPDAGSIIETQFITKYQDAFTIDLLVHNTTEDGGFKIYVDDVEYDLHPFGLYDEGMLYFDTPSGREFHNFYININSLQPGVHVIKIEKLTSTRLYLDKFRIFSSGSQEFSDIQYYPECTGDYCTCDDTTTTKEPTEPDLFCSNGLLSPSGDVCCESQCGSCGGSGCSSREGGSEGCCEGTIENSGVFCDSNSAPCIMTTEITTQQPTPSPTDEDYEFTCTGDQGLLSSNGVVCCAMECGQCGGSGCGSLFPGSSSKCCQGGIITNVGVLCSVSGEAPCIM